MADTPLTALLLSNQLTRLDAAPLKAREFWSLVDRTDALGIEVGDMQNDALADVANGDVTSERLAALLGATRAFAFEIERLGEAGITVLSALDERFPPLLRDRLQHGCPPHVFVAGPTDELGRPSLAVVGGDTDSPEAHAAARQAVAAAVVADQSVVSPPPGSGLSNTVIDEAVACEGDLVVVTSDGINRAARDPDLRRLVQQQRLCLVSPFVPDAIASAAAGRARDTVVSALAHHTIVIACDDGTGATWAAAHAAVQREPGSVFAFLGDGARPGNHALVELGAQPIRHLDELHAKLA
jgi:predicted Rossmann fold nucleotide-binding protein DprA/Smf involved in DNA uptake